MSGFLDLRKHSEEHAARIAAETKLAEAREALVTSYAEKGVRAVLEDAGYEVSDEEVEAFKPLLREAISEGLSARDIDVLLIESMEDTDD